MQEGESSLSVPTSMDASAADIVGFKDGVAVAPNSRSQSEMISLSIKCPSLTDASSESTLLSVPTTWSIAEVKGQIETSWVGKPQAQGMRMFRSGQMLTDDMIVGDIVAQSDRIEPAAIHLVIRNNAWSEPRPGLASRTSSNRPSRLPPSPHAAWVHANSTAAQSSTDRAPNAMLQPPFGPLPMPPTRSLRSALQTAQDRHLTELLDGMDPSMCKYTQFRDLLVWTYYSYLEMYEEAWKEAYGDFVKEPSGNHLRATGLGEHAKTVESLARSLKCSVEEVSALVKIFESDVLLWEPVEKELEKTKGKTEEAGFTYKTVTLRGLPYLLQQKRNTRSNLLPILLTRLQRVEELVRRMTKVISFQDLFEQRENMPSRHAGSRRTQGARTEGLAAAAAHGGPARFRVVLNMNELFNIAIPAFFLSLKMTLLVYIFTRGASTLKTCMIAGAGFLFVVLEAWKAAQRHNRLRRRAAAREAERRRGPLPPTSTAANNTAPDAAAAPADTTLESLRPTAPTRQQTESPLTLDYWIETLAYVGLTSEEREFGWRPYSNQRGAPQSNAVIKVVREKVLLPVLLLFVTLVPDIEQKRRRALEQREDLIRSTAKAVDDRRARQVEKAGEDAKEKEGSSLAAGSPSLPDEEVPSYLQHPYCQRILQQRRTGRQIDIAQEMEAAAAAADGQAEDQADMGFL